MSGVVKNELLTGICKVFRLSQQTVKDRVRELMRVMTEDELQEL